ncbi:MAG: hypothetical protein ACH37Z_12100 [Anaerolineae bacterium]
MFQRLVLRLCLTPLLTAGAVLGSAIVAGGAAHAGAAATADPHPAQPIAPSALALPVVLEAPAPLLVARGAATGPLFTAYGSRARLDFDAAGVTITQYGPRPPDLAGRLKGMDGLRFRRGADGDLLGAAVPPSAPPTARQRWSFSGARSVRPRALGWLPTRFNRLHGPQSTWELDRPCATGLIYAGLWDGVDLLVTPGAQGMALTLRADSAAELAQAGIQVDGGSTTVTATGAVAVTLPYGPVAEWQGLAPTGPASHATHLLTFLPEADPHSRRPAVIQATGFLYAGQWGLPGADRGLGIAVDPSGAAYITGETSDEDEDLDAYVVKVNPDGATLGYVTILGGDDYDAGYDIDVDASGQAYFGGATSSGQATLPVLMGPDLTYNGNTDTLVGKLDAGGKPVYLGYVGGEDADFAEGIRVDGAGQVYLEGVAQSTELSFPVREGPDLTHNGATDCFVAKIRAQPDDRQPARNMVYAGYIGGADHDIGVFDIPGSSDVFVTAGHIALDEAGNLYVSGMTRSRQDSFPDGDGFGALRGPDRTFGGFWDAFIAKVEPDGKRLAWAGYAGGNGEEHGNGVGVDQSGAVYISGNTNSPPLSLGVKVGPDLTPNGKTDALAVKVAPDGGSFVYLGYLGGKGDDAGSGATVTADGELIIVGYTDSGEDSLPVVGGPDLTYNDATVGDGDVLVARVKADPSDPDPVANLVHCGYVGGTVYDQGFWLDLDAAGNLYLVGDTESGADSFPNGEGRGAVAGVWPDNGGAGDAFIVKLGEPQLPHPSPTAPLPEPSPSTGPPSVTPPATTLPEPSATRSIDLTPTAQPTAQTAQPTVLPVPYRIFLPWLER